MSYSFWKIFSGAFILMVDVRTVLRVCLIHWKVAMVVPSHSQLGDVAGKPSGQSLQVFVAAADHCVHTGALAGTLRPWSTATVLQNRPWPDRQKGRDSALKNCWTLAVWWYFTLCGSQGNISSVKIVRVMVHLCFYFIVPSSQRKSGTATSCRGISRRKAGLWQRGFPVTMRRLRSHAPNQDRRQSQLNGLARRFLKDREVNNTTDKMCAASS